MKFHFIFYGQERVVSSSCMTRKELFDLVMTEYPGAQIVEVEEMRPATSTKLHQNLTRRESYEFCQVVYCDPITVA